MDELKSQNPGTGALIKPGQVLRYRKAAMVDYVAGWRSFTLETIAARYNRGDADYESKLRYILEEIFPKLKR